MYCIQSTPSRTRCDHCADFGWVHVIVHDRVNDRRQVLVKHRVTLRLEVIPKNLSKQVAELLHEGEDLLLGGVVSEEVIKVGDDVHADVAGQALGVSLGLGCQGSGQEEGEKEDCLHGNEREGGMKEWRV